jgi:hypothetical protein
MSLVVVTATTDPDRAYPCLKTWGGEPFIGVVNGRPWTPVKKPANDIGNLTRTWILVPEYLGTVPAFRLGVDHALEQTDAEVIACLHDDVEIYDEHWAQKVLGFFHDHPRCGLLGFGGAVGLGAANLYQSPYDPMQLARVGFLSNLIDAEVHGRRSLTPKRVACLDGFSQIGRRAFWEGYSQTGNHRTLPPLTYLERLGIKHHFYDGALGCLAARQGWETWFLPIRCRHLGGQTAVADADYHTWAASQIEEGDKGFWTQAHSLGYQAFKDVLPLRVP